ncbi:NYN domain-containing protein [filamentous cyanobacterium LEGE 11480]|uniref:NYN domain-containing protein n=1 Tax=Romeriopsis navalis LEGE 11480 TaxID=2777977 RepID=A0A928VRR6_9CYAN|nr:NYN domain-containing protein [Romeriopsis navalis]MBE9031766.1 NYN domain-containing protein [Romeriopsis navalis LEGE 11480]
MSQQTIAKHPRSNQNGHPGHRTHPENLLGNHATPLYSPKDRVAIFIDGANLFYAALQLQIEIDYVKLITTLTAGRRLVRPYFYTGVDTTNDKQKGFLHWMQHHGYRVITKPLTRKTDGSKRADLDVEMTVDMMKLSKHCDTIILISGDGRLSYAVSEIAKQGNRIEVVSLGSTTSETLVDAADRFIDLANLVSVVSRQNHSDVNERLAS